MTLRQQIQEILILLRNDIQVFKACTTLYTADVAEFVQLYMQQRTKC